jgi:hypothetical protein
MHQRESQLIPEWVKSPNLSHLDVEVRAEATSTVDASRRDVKVKWRSKSSKRGPLGHRFQIVHGLGSFNLNHT